MAVFKTSYNSSKALIRNLVCLMGTILLLNLSFMESDYLLTLGAISPASISNELPSG